MNRESRKHPWPGPHGLELNGRIQPQRARRDVGMDPYGFIGKQQALTGRLESLKPLASALVDLLLNNKATAPSMRESLVLALEKSQLFVSSMAVTSKLERLDFLTLDQLHRLEAACQNNDQVQNAFGVPKRIAKLIDPLRPKDQPTF